MAKLFKPKAHNGKPANGRNDPWWIRFKDPNGKHRRFNTGTANATSAQTFLAKKLVEVAENRFLDIKRVSHATFADHAESVSKLKTHLKSFKKFRECVKVLNEYFGRLRLVDISLEKILGSQAEMQTRTHGKAKKKIGPASVNRWTTVLYELLEYAVEFGKVDKNPMRSKKFTKLEEPETIVQPLTVGQWRALEKAAMDIAPKWFYAFMSAAFHTGLRLGNLVHLLWEQVDFDHRKLLIGRTKSGHPLYLSMNDELYLVLKSVPVNADSPYVFVDEKGRLYARNNAGTKSIFRSNWNRVRIAAGMPGFNWHGFRHNFGSQLAMLGYDQRGIMDAMAHRSVNTSMRYMHWSPTRQAAALDLLAKKFATLSAGSAEGTEEVKGQAWHYRSTSPQLVTGELNDAEAKTLQKMEAFTPKNDREG
jgi:integrase